MKDRELLQMALDHLEGKISGNLETWVAVRKELRESIRARLAQKDDEPVARVNSEGFIVEVGDLPIEEGSLLYLHPPAKGGK
jgi:hypothetical protein